MKTAILTAAAVLVMPAFAFAQDKCYDTAKDQAALNACADAAFKKSDKKLNELYKQIEARLNDDADTKTLLVQAQRDWVKFRDAECSFQTAGAAGGSMVPMLIAQCMDSLTQSRVKDFEGYLKCQEGDLSCPVPAANTLPAVADEKPAVADENGQTGLAQAADPMAIPLKGDYYIVAKHSYKALTAFEGKDGEIVLGQSARKPNDDPAQLWTITRATGEMNDATYQIRSRRYGTYLAGGDEDESGDTSVVLKDEQSAGGQAWRFKPHLNSYGIELNDNGTTLNVRANEQGDDAQIIVYDASLDDNAQWMLYPAGNGDRTATRSAEASELDNLNKRYRLAPMPASDPEAKRLRRYKLMDYQPSGVFVKKGEAVSVIVEGLSPSPDGLTVMIGPMNSFYDEKPQNDPQLVTAKEGRTNFTARRDGLVYFRYADSGFNAALPPIEVAIAQGGSSIPLYIKGKTSLDDWREMLSDMPRAPFVEMISERAAITATRKVYMKAPQNDPAKILDTIEQILGWYDAVAGLDGSSELHRASRLRMHYQQDTVTSAKVFDYVYMYAGPYFIGVPGSAMDDLLDLKTLRNAWSIWHETGHMYQQSDWTWGDVVEVTVNIYSLYAQAQFGRPSRLKEPDADTGKNSLDLAVRYLGRKTRDFGNAKQMQLSADDGWENWVRLVMFDQLRRGFGEGFYPTLERYYREHPLDDAAQEDADDEDVAKQVQTFILRASMIAKHDLTRFFSDWGVHIEQETADRLKRLNLPPADPQLSRVGLNGASRGN